MVNTKKCDLLAETDDSLTALSYAQNSEIFKRLAVAIEAMHGKDVLSKVLSKTSKKENETVLHMALTKNWGSRKQVIRAIYEYCDAREILKVRNSKGRMAFQIGVQIDRLEALKLLEKETNLLEVDDEKCHILGIAAEEGSLTSLTTLKWLISLITERHGPKEVAKMLNSPNSKGSTPLILAAWKNRLEIVEVSLSFSISNFTASNIIIIQKNDFSFFAKKKNAIYSQKIRRIARLL